MGASLLALAKSIYYYNPSKRNVIRFLLLLRQDPGRISSVGRAFDCRAGGRGFHSRGRTITQGLKISEK